MKKAKIKPGQKGTPCDKDACQRYRSAFTDMQVEMSVLRKRCRELEALYYAATNARNEVESKLKEMAYSTASRAGMEMKCGVSHLEKARLKKLIETSG